MRIWGKNSKKSLSNTDRLFFYILCFCEIFYKFGFLCNQFWRWLHKPKKAFCPVVSIGNLSVGGTGKTIICSFIAQILKKNSCTPIVVSKGYGGGAAKTGKSVVVGDGVQCFVGASVAGDEPFMLACDHKIPVVVGTRRKESVDLCHTFWGDRAGAIILDDAYQSYDIDVGLSILLLDGHAPFGNGHCLPAGFLREKDLSRADVVIFMFGDADQEADIKDLHISGIVKAGQVIVRGRRRCAGFFRNNCDWVIEPIVEGVVLVAGIGSFEQFYQMVINRGICVVDGNDYGDHHRYTKDDYYNIVKRTEGLGLRIIVTTEKDWVKLRSFIDNDQSKSVVWYVMRVEFEFLTRAEYSIFRSVLIDKLALAV